MRAAFRGNPLEDEVRANEARATGDENEIFHAGYAASHHRAVILSIMSKPGAMGTPASRVELSEAKENNSRAALLVALAVA